MKGLKLIKGRELKIIRNLMAHTDSFLCIRCITIVYSKIMTREKGGKYTRLCICMHISVSDCYNTESIYEGHPILIINECMVS